MTMTSESIDTVSQDRTQHHTGNAESQLVASVFNFPRLRENLWQIQPESPHSYVETLSGEYEIATADALSFMRMRSHCTGHNSLAEIEKRSGMSSTEVLSTVLALAQAGITLPNAAISEKRTDSLEQIRDKLQRISAIWSRELSRNFVANELLDNNLPKTVLVGWLLEMYHYVKDFPQAIACGARQADGALGEVLNRYVAEETGHESFVLQTLLNIGLSEAEIQESRPLVSTRLIGFLLRELFELEPASVLLVAAVVEAQDIPAENLDEFQFGIESHYALPAGALAPYFEHQTIDASLGHSQLLSENIGLFQVNDVAVLNKIVDKLHDLKHAFELQSEEIKMYYGDLAGKYFPRQAVAFTAL